MGCIPLGYVLTLLLLFSFFNVIVFHQNIYIYIYIYCVLNLNNKIKKFKQ